MLNDVDCTFIGLSGNGARAAVTECRKLSCNTKNATDDLFRVIRYPDADSPQRGWHPTSSRVRCMIPLLMKSKTCVSSPSYRIRRDRSLSTVPITFAVIPTPAKRVV